MSDTLSPAEQFAAWAQECGWDPAWTEENAAEADFEPPFEPCVPVAVAELPPADTAAMMVEARLAVVRVQLTALAAELPGVVFGLEPRELMAALHALQRVANVTASCDQAVVAAIDERDVAAGFGMTSTTALLIDRLLLMPGEAIRRVTTARGCGPRTGFTGEALPPLRPQVAAAQAKGDISPAHAAAIVRGMKHLPPDEPAPAVDDIERSLVELSRREHPGVVTEAARATADRFDRKDPAAQQRAQQRRRTVSFHQDEDGMGSLSGTLTPELLAQLTAVLSPLAQPRPADANGEDERTPGQRRHDALADMCSRLLHSDTLPESGGTPATVAVTIRERDLRAYAAAAQAGRTGLAFGSGSAEAGAGNTRVTTSLGTTMSIARMLHLACEADIIPVVLNDAGGIMSHGRVKRRATKAQRTALRARDGGCSFPGCRRPPEWCEAHHVLEWLVDQGETEIDNLTLLCGHHHRNFHTWGWTVQMTDGVPMWTPPWRLDPDRTPIRNHARHQPDPVGVRARDQARDQARDRSPEPAAPDQ